MSKKMLIDAAHAEEVRVCVLENRKVEDFDFESSSRKPLRGNIYLARVTRVEPSLQAAFVEYGGNRHGFLAFNEIHPDYYQIPVSDREALQAADAEEAALAAELDLVQRGDEEDDDEDGHAYAHDDSDDDGAVEDVSVEDESDEPDADDVRAAAQPLNVDGDDDSAEAASADDVDENVDDDGRDEEEEEENADDDEERDADSDDDQSFTDDDADGAGDHVDPSAEDASDEEAASDEDAPEADPIAAAGDGGDQPIPFVTPIFPFVAASADEEKADDADEEDADAKEEAPAADPRTSKRAELLERYKEAKRKRARLLRNYKIQEVIKRRQILLIQVVKEERGNKGAALTTYMSLAGRYCVLMPNTARGGGISRKIPNASDRKRLRRIVDSLDVPQGMGLIIRTAGAKRTKTEIKRDYDYLIRLWENIRSLTLESIAPCLIYEEASLIKRAIRDLYDKDISKVLVEGEEGYREAKDFMKMLMPSHAKNVQPYKDKLPLFVKNDVEKQLDAMYQPTVRLKSGGYLVINQTEALIAVDVNSGKATRERNIELTALKTNLEAAVETARQCRLRDLAGLIVIDFIDMEENKNNRAVEKKLKEALKHDRARIQVGRISGFGLLEMSRQRRRSGIVDGTTHACPTCNGAGAVRSNEMAALRILRAVESEAISRRAAIVSVKASLDVTLYVLNYKRAWLKRIEDDYAVSIEVIADQSKAGDQYDIEKRGEPKPRPVETSVVRADLSDAMPDEDEDATSEVAADESEEEKPARRKRRRRRKKRQDDDGAEAQRSDDAPGEGDAPAEDNEREEEARASDDEDGGERKKRRRRGRRGGRRKNKRTAEDANGEASPDAGDGDEVAASGTNAEDVVEDQGASDEAPAAAPSTADETIDQPIADEPIAHEEARAEPEAEPLEDAEPDAAPVAADAPPTADEIAERVKNRKSSKKGWWSRALGG